MYKDYSDDDKYTKDYSCGCRDRFGHPKRLYHTMEEAREAMYSSFSSAVEIYPCRKRLGYHLTSHPRGKKGLRK